MKKFSAILFFCFLANLVFAQKTLMVEKVGTSHKYFYHTGDYLKLRITSQDTLLKGKLWSIGDSVISVWEVRPFDVRISGINSVYKKFRFPGKFGKSLCIGGAAIFGIIGFNHLINNEQVFTQDMFIISGAMIGAGLISISLSEKRCKTPRWKVKVLDIDVSE